eukprot:scaffold107305_cov16-Tisochrysis_lutea.AAC.1
MYSYYSSLLCAFQGHRGTWSDPAAVLPFSQDLSKRYASALLGLTNVAGSIPGIIGVALVRVHPWTELDCVAGLAVPAPETGFTGFTD